MAEPTCQKCGGHNFDCRHVRSIYDGGESVVIYIVFCKNCGWIASCAGGGYYVG